MATARSGAPIALSSASVALAAAAANGWPPYVVPWSPAEKTWATSSLAQHAPIGTPLPRAFASVTMSALPVVVAYLFLSRQFIAGLTTGSVKG